MLDRSVQHARSENEPHERPETKTLGVTEARQELSRLLNDVFSGEEPVIIEKNGIPVAALISARDLERLEDFDQKRRKALEVCSEFSRAFENVPLEELEREVERAVREARSGNSDSI